MVSHLSSDATVRDPRAAKPTLIAIDDVEIDASPRLSKKERKRLRRAQRCFGRVAITNKERKRRRRGAKRRGRVAITDAERERLASRRQQADTIVAEDTGWYTARIAELLQKQNAAWEKQTVVPSKSMQLRLDRAARDMRQRVERGEGGLEVRLLDVRFWDFRAAFDGVDPDLRLWLFDSRLFGMSSRLSRDSSLFDWWLYLTPHERAMLLEMVRLEVGETAVVYRPKRKCPYCGKVVRVVDQDREEWPFLARHRRRRSDREDCAGSFYLIDDLTDVSAQPRE